MAMLAGMELDLFSTLADGPRSAGEIAAVVDADPERLSLLLYALVAAELLTVKDGAFANTPETARFLVAGQPGSMVGLSALYRELWEAGLMTTSTSKRWSRQIARPNDTAKMG